MCLFCTRLRPKCPELFAEERKECKILQDFWLCMRFEATACHGTELLLLQLGIKIYPASDLEQEKYVLGCYWRNKVLWCERQHFMRTAFPWASLRKLSAGGAME